MLVFHTAFKQKSFLAAVISIALCVSASAKVTDQTKYKSFTVNGETPLEIVVDMYRKGPRVKGKSALATIQVGLKTDLKMVTGKGCRVARYKIHATYTITLPRHRNERALSKRTRRAYRRFVKHAKRHEHQHRKIYRGCLRRIDVAVRRLGRRANCKIWAREMLRTAKKLGARCSSETKSFDKREAAAASRTPLLKEALIDAKATKSARLSRVAIASALTNDAGDMSASQVLLNRENRWRE